ncbi:MAG: RNA polymerase sigma factor [Planctomycetes bacterium]|nr:RNA polymerase sigma factor [Planctomycetota bacterium]
MTDEELVRRHLRGDRAAFEGLLDRFEGPLLRYAGALLGNGDGAQDAVQEAFLRLLGSGGELRGVSSVSGWLFHVTRNVCRDRVKKERRMTERERVYRESHSGSATAPPEAALVEKEVNREVERALAGLPRKQREVLLLKVWEGLSYKEIAGRTGLTVSNVGYHIHQATLALAGSLRAAGILEREEARS